MQVSDEKLLQLGNHIKSLRKKRKLTLENICYKNGLEPSTLSRIENGQVEPKYLTLLQLANAYDMKLSQLLDF
ncbi:helix-turn-helix transcriptional regulator [bacterium]|nr:helix-turn-helix transcriptional regulator [bacterium]